MEINIFFIEPFLIALYAAHWIKGNSQLLIAFRGIVLLKNK